jgi:hypothetical protein
MFLADWRRIAIRFELRAQMHTLSSSAPRFDQIEASLRRRSRASRVIGGIDGFRGDPAKTWMAGTSPAMTANKMSPTFVQDE